MLWNFSLVIGVRERWLIMTALAIVAAVSWHIHGQRTRKHFHVQAGHMFFLIYVLIALLFCATESDAFFTEHRTLSPVTKKLLLAGSSGILVQLAIWLNRLARSTEPRRSVWPIYLDAFMGFLTGMMGAVVFASTQSSFASVLDQQAVLGGAVGGGLGVRLFDLLATRFAPSTRESQAATAAGGHSKVTCQFAGQAYSAGAHVAMPNELGGIVVKTCNPKTGQWVEVSAVKPGPVGS